MRLENKWGGAQSEDDKEMDTELNKHMSKCSQQCSNKEKIPPSFKVTVPFIWSPVALTSRRDSVLFLSLHLLDSFPPVSVPNAKRKR